MARNKYRELAPEYKRRKKIQLLKVLGGFLLLLFLIAAFPVGLVFYSSLRSYYLRTEGLMTQGVVIDDKNYLGNHNIRSRFTYSYEFVVKSKKYTGNSLDSKYRVGDAVKIKYAPTYPRFNEIVK
jgi:hypothetical protein